MSKKYCYDYPMVSATATVLPIFRDNNNLLKSFVLLGKRSKNVSTFPNYLSMIGGFLEPKTKDNPREFLENTAVRESKEEANLEILEENLNLYFNCSDPATDPRAHVINACYWVEIYEQNIKDIKPGDDIESLHLFGFKKILDNDIRNLAFNHLDLAKKGINHFLEKHNFIDKENK